MSGLVEQAVQLAEFVREAQQPLGDIPTAAELAEEPFGIGCQLIRAFSADC